MQVCRSLAEVVHWQLDTVHCHQPDHQHFSLWTNRKTDRYKHRQTEKQKPANR